MTSLIEAAALVALLRARDSRRAARSWRAYAEQVEERNSALSLLEEEHGLLAGELLDAAQAAIEGWKANGIDLVTVLDDEYPANLRAAHDRPPLIFVAGRLIPGDWRSVAVVGSRHASQAGLNAARTISRHLSEEGHAVVSGLAAGVDTAAHTAALARGGRTIAVLGTGLEHCYPVANAPLQRRLADEHAVVSQFWPDSPPTRQSFPMRNAVMSGMTLATVVVEASPTSGARLQARLALGQGRAVFLLARLLSQPWARELARRPGTKVVTSAREITAALARLHATALTA